MKKPLENSLFNFFLEEYERNEFNFFYGKWVSLIGHSFYWLLWTYVIPQSYESFILRLVAVAIFFPFFLPKKIIKTNHNKAICSIYWYLCLCFNLPFLFTYMTLMNNFSGVWLVCETMGILMTVILAPRLTMLFVTMATGIISAYLLFVLQNKEIIFGITQLQYLLILPMILVGGILFNISMRSGEIKVKLLEEKSDILKSFAGSIAHELRNPLNVINISASQLNAISNRVSNLDLKKNIAEINKIISSSVSQANKAINLILSDIKDRVIIPGDFSLFKPSLIIPEIVNNFVYTSSAQKLKVKLKIDPDSDFIFRASEDRLTFILYNLLKNAIYYLRDYPKSEIIIGNELRILEDKEWLAIYVYDTGPGIPPEIMPRLFDDFFSFGKRDGTGLGLSFCRRNMQNFSGKIICESEYNNEDSSNQSWTKFSLLFPKLTQKEIDELVKIIRKRSLNSRDEKLSKLKDPKDYFSITNDKTILYADDEEINLMIVKRKLEPFGFKITCANNGEELLKLYLNSINKEYGQSDFDLIITDINMPFYSGIEVTEKIRQFEKEGHVNKLIPIIALSGDDDNEDIDKFYKVGINDFFIKGSDPDLLVKVVVSSLLDATHNMM